MCPRSPPGPDDYLRADVELEVLDRALHLVFSRETGSAAPLPSLSSTRLGAPLPSPELPPARDGRDANSQPLRDSSIGDFRVLKERKSARNRFGLRVPATLDTRSWRERLGSPRAQARSFTRSAKPRDGMRPSSVQRYTDDFPTRAVRASSRTPPSAATRAASGPEPRTGTGPFPGKGSSNPPLRARAFTRVRCASVGQTSGMHAQLRTVMYDTPSSSEKAVMPPCMRIKARKITPARPCSRKRPSS